MKPVNSIESVTCVIEMSFVVNEAAGAVQLLISVIERIEAKTGCQMCSISRDIIDPGRFRYCEVWALESAFRAHVQSDEFRHILAALDMCCEEPGVTIGTLSGLTGIEYLRQLRSGPGPA